MRARWIIGSILAFGASPGAQAQTSDTAGLQAFTRTPSYAGFLNHEFALLPPEVFQRCPALVSNGSQVTVVSPITFGVDGVPNGGAWKQAFPVSGCGNDTVINFYFQATSAGKINAVIGAPGDSHASPVLQQDAYGYAKIGLVAKLKDCGAIYIKTTKFEGYGVKNPSVPDQGAGAPKRPWWETWTMIGCGRTFNVPLDFLPDATGTRVIQPAGIIEN